MEETITLLAQETTHAPPESPLQRFLRNYLASRIALCGSVLLIAIVLAAIFAPWLAPQNPYDLSQVDILDARLPPGAQASANASMNNAHGSMTYLLGTDEQGRDMLSAILYGLRISVTVGVASTIVALAIGLVLGLIAGYAGGRVDAFIMRIADLQLAFPPILVALILLALMGPGIGKIIVALIAVQWAYYARTARGAALVERQKEYIEAARGLGLSSLRIAFRHLLPNCLPPVIAIAALQIASAISLEATLSFLGLGLPVTEPSLGLLIANGFEYLLSGRYWISLFPGIALVVTVVAINLVADQLRDVLNPRLQTQ
ncbi:ABC transporter permease [Oxalicibacterium solurbis]|uniref:Peptide ABC transporter permease n=1 Tax=Oxalicibacterium solurbis TaxID=69280 RepID=A0A8J3AZG6_9BURK|nr:ABC transporter permease [Oxalicibacterium solurbis]GGI54956.1 peptide ABC transporter permease [Oxalicibacterium solurbis]